MSDILSIIGIIVSTLGVVISLLFFNASLDNSRKVLINKVLYFITFDHEIMSLFSEATINGMFSTSNSLSVEKIKKFNSSMFRLEEMMKDISYKNKFGICSKRTTTTEFIWKQSHITASYHYRLAGFLLFIVSIVFVFIHYPLIELAIFVIGLIIPRIVVEVGAKKMSVKYADMKKKYDHVQKKNKNKAE